MTLPVAPKAHTLRLPDELFLLCLRPEGSLRHAQSVGYGLAGAALLELLLGERICIDGKKVWLRSAEPVGHAGVDALLAQIFERDGKSLNSWIRRYHGKLKDPVVDQLVHAELVSRYDVVSLGPLAWTRFPPVQGDDLPRLRQRVGLALTDDITDDRTTILAALLDAVGVLRDVVPAIDWAQRGGRVRSLLETTYSTVEIASAVKAVRQEIQSAEAAGA